MTSTSDHSSSGPPEATPANRFGASALATPANAVTVTRMILALPLLAFRVPIASIRL